MPLTLYKIDAGAPSRAAMMALDAIGINCERKNVDLTVGEHLTPEFIKKNPTSTVPVLQDGDFYVSDSHAIIIYLVSKYGADKREALYPNDLNQRATIHERLHLDTGTIFISLRNIIVSAITRKATKPSAEEIYAVEESYKKLERCLERTKFIALDHITIADISAVSTVSTLNEVHNIDGAKFPRVKQWLNDLQSESWYSTGNAALPQFTQTIKFLWDNNKKSS